MNIFKILFSMVSMFVAVTILPSVVDAIDKLDATNTNDDEPSTTPDNRRQRPPVDFVPSAEFDVLDAAKMRKAEKKRAKIENRSHNNYYVKGW